jgi:hypothetical protein
MKIGTRGWIHHKNLIGIQLMNAENSGIHFSLEIDQTEECDYLMVTDSSSANGNFSKGVIYGPHIDLRSSEYSNINNNPHTYVNFLSPWNKLLGDILYPGKNIIDLPFPVDINKFQPAEKNGEPVIYFKRRDRSILDRFLEYMGGNSYRIFDYSSGYNEDDFKESVAKAPYCVWIGCHESQGFALQETLSSDTPIFIIDVKSLRDEIGGGWDNWMTEIDLKATSASYFDHTCGIITGPESLGTSEFGLEFNSFIGNLDKFKPRDFIIENLSPDACIKKWLNKLS